VSRLVAGVELGGSKCVCILARGPGDILAEVRLPTTTPGETLSAIRAQIDEWRALHAVEALGIASFGPLELDPYAPTFGRIVKTTKPDWSDTDLLAALVPAGLPARLDTDVNGAAFAEGRWGAAQGLDSFAYITVGTGVGVGSIVNGATVTGLGHSEAGHMRVPRLPGDAWPGACAFHGDGVEGLASGPAIAAASGSDARDLSDGDFAWQRAAAALAAMCHNLVLTTTPRRILSGGGVTRGRAYWIAGIRDRLVESLVGYAWAERIEDDPDFISLPAFGTRAGPLGAIALGLAALGTGR